MAVPKITLVPYLQKWDHNNRKLSIRILVAPTGDPLQPLLLAPPGVKAFADCNLAFRINISDSVDALPQRDLIDQPIEKPAPATPNRRIIFKAIKVAMGIADGPAGDTFAEQKPHATQQLRKYLPLSYRHSFDFVQPRTSLAVIDDTYQCLIHCPPDHKPPITDTKIGWGEAIAFSLRRPRLAEELGLIVPLVLDIDAAPRLENGGWLWVELAPTSDYFAHAGLPDFQRSLATRVPELPKDSTRPIFTPVVFPVSDNAAEASTLGNTDKVFTEAVRFDDGFSKIVHARQPLGTDPLAETEDQPSAVRDEGVQLGWDDEDILEGQNRVLGPSPDGENNVVAPRGIFGYRVDVREYDDTNPKPWITLSKVSSPFNIGVDLGTASEERWTEVHPSELGDQLWLAPWYVHWRGESLVMLTKEEQRLIGVPDPKDESDTPLEVDKIELRYGKRYEFRVRLADNTGGGPAVDHDAVRSGEAPVAFLHMKRHLPPKRPEIRKPVTNPDGSVGKIPIYRPVLGYPEAVFAAGSTARADLLQQHANNDDLVAAAIAAGGTAEDANTTPPFIRDPDTPYLRIRVLLRPPTYDPAADEDGWIEWYETSRAFPSDPNQAMELAIDWQDAADYHDLDISGQLGADGTVSGDVPLVRARDVRLKIYAVGGNNLSYFASEKARIGDTDSIDLHTLAKAESDLLTTLPISDQLRSVFLRPDPVGERAETHSIVAQNDSSWALVDRLALAADLTADDAVLMGRPGERVAFGCAGLTYYAAPDATSIEFAEPGELAGQWINIVQAVVNRDWTWRGSGSPTVRVKRKVLLPGAPGDVPQSLDVGEIELMHTINVQARRNPERGFTRLIFIDALPPAMGSDNLPYEIDVTYEMKIALKANSVAQSVSTHLPVVTPPIQVPKVMAAGLALTPYQTGEDYTRTESRTKRLWLEFDLPPQDSRDGYFVRVVHRTPDPMLMPNYEPVADPPALDPIALDPEWVRVITPGQVQDLAGLSAMQQLEPADNSKTQFLVPLPPNTDPASPELFSFYTYEIRVGHGAGAPMDPFWSTAQARFGEPLVLEGVQHPPPELACSVFYGARGRITARAPYAVPYLGQKRVAPDKANTQIWFILYARIMQADGESWRNVQIDLKKGHREKQIGNALIAPHARADWTAEEIKDALTLADLDLKTALTMLAAELMPEPNGSFIDPLGGDLGQVRVLRTSPLMNAERSCCISPIG
ncbi:MAG: hypothetical protein WBG37_10585 [Desulfobacterales bacterium]